MPPSLILGKKSLIHRCLCTRWLPLNVPVDPACVVPVQWEWVPQSRIWNWANYMDITQCLLDKCRIAMDCSVLLCCILCELLYDSSRGEGPIWLLITRKHWCEIALQNACCCCYWLLLLFQWCSRAKLLTLIFQRRSMTVASPWGFGFLLKT